MSLTFLDDTEYVASRNYFHDATVGGYIDPKEMLIEEDAKKVQEALDLVCAFFEQAEENGFLS